MKLEKFKRFWVCGVKIWYIKLTRLRHYQEIRNNQQKVKIPTRKLNSDFLLFSPPDYFSCSYAKGKKIKIYIRIRPTTNS